MHITLKPNRLFKILGYTLLVLTIGNFCSVLLVDYLPSEITNGLGALFNFNNENTLSSLFTVLLIFLCSLVMYYLSETSRTIKNSQYAWLIMSFVFIVLAVDEAISIHERLLPRYIEYISQYNTILFINIAITGLLGIGASIILIPFLLKISRKHLLYFILSGIIYLIGVLVLDQIGEMYYERTMEESFNHFLLYTVEELLEMTGMALFLYSLLSYCLVSIEKNKISF